MNTQKILIFGSNGLLGQRTVELLGKNLNYELFAASIEEESFSNCKEYSQIDITNKAEVKKVIKEINPDFIINCAAYTAVDKAEKEKELAYKINAQGIENIAHQARWSKSHVIHVSTDYIFDGNEGPYDETHKPNPINYYGKSKLAGENLLRSSECKFTILRTNVLYGIAKNEFFDFVKWVVRSLKDGKSINIVNDQINNATFTDDLISGFDSIIKTNKTGIFNFAGKELLNRYDFTIRIADYFKLDKSLIKQISTAELNLPAPRPLKSGLINLKAETQLNYKPTSLEESLRIINEYSEL